MKDFTISAKVVYIVLSIVLTGVLGWAGNSLIVKPLSYIPEIKEKQNEFKVKLEKITDAKKDRERIERDAKIDRKRLDSRILMQLGINMEK